MEGFLGLTVVSIAVSFVIVLITRIFTKPGEIRDLKEDMKVYKEKSSKAQKDGDTKKAKEYTNLMLKLSSKQFKLNMKPLMFTMVIILLVLQWMNATYSGVVTVLLPFALPLFGMDMGWFWWYVILTLPTNLFFRKALGVE